jgi:hypothetical protein
MDPSLKPPVKPPAPTVLAESLKPPVPTESASLKPPVPTEALNNTVVA